MNYDLAIIGGGAAGMAGARFFPLERGGAAVGLDKTDSSVKSSP